MVPWAVGRWGRWTERSRFPTFCPVRFPESARDCRGFAVLRAWGGGTPWKLGPGACSQALGHSKAGKGGREGGLHLGRTHPVPGTRYANLQMTWF